MGYFSRDRDRLAIVYTTYAVHANWGLVYNSHQLQLVSGEYEPLIELAFST